MFGPLKYEVTGVVSNKNVYDKTEYREESYAVTMGTTEGPLKVRPANKQIFDQMKEGSFCTIYGHSDSYVDKGGKLNKSYIVDKCVPIQLVPQPAGK